MISQRTVNGSPFARHRGILKTRSDSTTRSILINVMADLPPLSDTYWYLYNKDDYIGEMEALEIHNVYTSEINKAVSNPGDLNHYYNSNPCDMCGKTGNTFDECELLKNTTR